MQSLVTVLEQLAPSHDPELAQGYQRYMAALEPILTPEQIETYAALIQRTGVIRIFEDLSPDELAELSPEESTVAANIIADQTATMENRRVASLLIQRGEESTVPDFAPIEELERGA
jgi:hypothetical protein